MRTFNSLTQAKIENAQSRIYLGIHWAFDRDEGIKEGDTVADYIFEHAFQPNSHVMDPQMLASGNGASSLAGIQPSAADAALLMLSDSTGGGTNNRKRV